MLYEVIRSIIPFSNVVHHTLFGLPLFSFFFFSKCLSPQIKLGQLLLSLITGMLEFGRLILSMHLVTLWRISPNADFMWRVSYVRWSDFYFGDKLTFFLYKYVTWCKATQIKSTLTWDSKWSQTGLIFHFGIKFHFVLRELHYQHSHDFRRSQTHFGAKLTEIKFQTAVSCPCK